MLCPDWVGVNGLLHISQRSLAAETPAKSSVLVVGIVIGVLLLTAAAVGGALLWRRMRSGLPGVGSGRKSLGEMDRDPKRGAHRPGRRETWCGDRPKERRTETREKWRRKPRDGGTEAQREGTEEGGDRDPEEGVKDVERGGMENWEKGRQAQKEGVRD